MAEISETSLYHHKRRGSRNNLSRDEYLRDPMPYAVRGEALPHARLDADTVRAIRANVHGWTARRWAEYLGVHKRTVDKVQTYESWRHVV